VAGAGRAVDVEPDAGPAIASAAPPPAAAPPVHEEPPAVAAAPPAVKPAPVPATKPAQVSAAKPAPAARTSASTPADAKSAWLVQLGSFGEEANARRLADRVRTFGYKPDVSSVRSGGRSMFRVRVGPAASHNEADATASALGAHGFTARVVAAE
jgi:DedD protein